VSERKRGAAVDLRVGERIDIDNGRAVVVLEHKHGKAARLRIVADESVRIVYPKRARAQPQA
jgi:hypothetical protein